MNHKKILFTITLGLIAAVLSLTTLVSAANLNQAVGTLPANDEWSIMAHAAVNQNVGQSFLRGGVSNNIATDYEKRILAITAIGENPRTFGSEDFIAKLQTFFDGNQIGDQSLLNDDIFGILALSSAGISDNIVSKARGYLLAHQNSDGGFGFGTGVGSDSNTTAMAIAALARVGSIPDSAFSYIARTQDSSGGYGFTPGTPADGASTAWVIAGLNTANRSVPATATQFLDGLQLSDGSFKWKPGDASGSSLVTAYAVIALSGRGMPVRSVTITNPPQPPPPPTNPEIQLCVHINYDGGCESFPANDADLGDNSIRNDNASSILVPVGKMAALFESAGFLGKCEEFRANDPDLRNNAIGNDTASSIKIGSGCPVIVPPPNPPNPPPPPPPNPPNPPPPPPPNPPGPPPPPPPPPAPANIHVTITYPGNKIFVGDISYFANQTALQALESGANKINLLYEIKQTSFGPFVSSIDGYASSGINGWQYAINGTVPNVGASNYILHDQDRMQWFYGAPQIAPF